LKGRWIVRNQPANQRLANNLVATGADGGELCQAAGAAAPIKTAAAERNRIGAALLLALSA